MAIWLLSMPVMAQVNRAMQDFTGTKYQASDQYKGTAQARITRDHSDGLKILWYLQERDPFTAEKNLINLAVGEVADESVNVHRAFEIRKSLSMKWVISYFSVFSFNRKDKVVPMNTKSSISIEGKKIRVNSALLCQRLIVVYSLEGLSTVFGYKLSARPMLFFDKDDLMNEADKPKLKYALSKLLHETVHVIPSNSKYVLDDGSYLHKVPWTFGHTFVQICQAYVT